MPLRSSFSNGKGKLANIQQCTMSSVLGVVGKLRAEQGEAESAMRRGVEEGFSEEVVHELMLKSK
jgi:hypothetical protein